MAAAPISQIDTIWRIESPRIVASLTRMVRDLATAEDLAQDAMVAALQQWPAEGVPRNPGAWLMAAARRRAIDHLRRHKLVERKHEELVPSIEDKQEQGAAEIEALAETDVSDDLLRLIFTSCHPVLTPEARVALTLRLLGGLTTGEIARAFLVPEPAIAQRIVRAKRTLAEKRVPYEVPHGAELAERLQSVLDVVYLIFNEGYAATSGDDWLRPALCEDALRLGRILAELAPREPEVHGLVALMEIQASRTRARTNAAGEPVLLLDQNRSLWDHLLIRRGLDALARAERLNPARGPYTLQAAIAACHARAIAPQDTDWRGIATLYRQLGDLTPSPVIELNRAVAVAMADGPAAGLALVDLLAQNRALRDYHLLPSVRGDFLYKLGRRDEARVEFERAAAMARNTRERDFLLGRARACR